MGRCQEIYLGNEKARHQVVQEARIYLLLYSLVEFVAPVWSPSFQRHIWRFWVMPAILGQPFLRFYLLAEHRGRRNSNLVTENTRTVSTNRFYRRLAWNMPYQIERHAWPSVPFHNLPALHNELVLEDGEEFLDRGKVDPSVKGREGYLAFNKRFVQRLGSTRE